jgi:hypothetical protein
MTWAEAPIGTIQLYRRAKTSMHPIQPDAIRSCGKREEKSIDDGVADTFGLIAMAGCPPEATGAERTEGYMGSVRPARWHCRRSRSDGAARDFRHRAAV